MVKGGNRRRWSDEEKRSICQQTEAPGVSVAQVARRYAMNANMIFKWLRDPKFAPEPAERDEAEDAVFLPVEIDVAPSKVPTPASPPEQAPSEHFRHSAVSGGRIEIEFAGGHRISAEGGFDPDLLARLLKGLMV